MKKGNLIAAIICLLLAVVILIFGFTARGGGFLDLSNVVRYICSGIAVLLIILGGVVAYLGKKK